MLALCRGDHQVTYFTDRDTDEILAAFMPVARKNGSLRLAFTSKDSIGIFRKELYEKQQGILDPSTTMTDEEFNNIFKKS